MKIISKKIFEGRNIYSHKKCIRIDVDLCGYCEIPSKDIPNFNERLVEILPELKLHRCGIDEEGGFVIRLKEGTYLAHICEHIIIAIQNKLGIEVAYGKAREIKDDLYYIIFQYEYKKVGIETARLAVDLINSLIKGENIDFEKRMDLLEEILSREVIGPSTGAIKEAAERYGLPVFQIGNSGFYQIGYGKQGRIIEGTIGNNTSCIAADIASDKYLTKELLRGQNIPVAEGFMVGNIFRLLRGVDKLGYPIVIKPRYGCKGQGIKLNIKNEKELLESYNEVRKKYEDIIVEEYIKGNDYRVCVVDNDVVAVSLRVPPYVIGDGKKDLRELIRELNEDPVRGYDHEKPLTKIKIDNELIRIINKQGFNLNTIVEKEKLVYLRENANISTGGMAIDYTDKICGENKELCIRVAKTIGLDVCGIDIKAKDLNEPLHGQGAIIEVNAAPGIRMHLYPSIGKRRDVGEAILKLQYNGIPNNIPVVSITGTNGKTTTTRLISHVLRNMGYNVGMTSTDGIYIDGKCIHKGDDTGYYSARAVLQNKDVDIAVLETARGGIIRNGLAYDLADIAVITNITEDHLGIDSINTMEELSFVKSLVGEAVKEEGYVVINGDDKWSKNILNRIDKKKIIFSKNKDNKLLIETINNNGIGIFLEDNSIYAINNKRKYKIINIKSMPLTFNGVLDFNIENAMAACAALIGLNVDYCMISKGFKTFKLDEEHNSGRFNMYNVDGVNIILDYGHNYEGYKGILESLLKIKTNKIIGVVGIPGDRSDENIIRIGELCGEYLDYTIIKEDRDLRGRESGEVAKLINTGLEKDKNNKSMIILEEKEALLKAIEISNEGDIVIVFYERLEPLVSMIKKLQDKDNETSKISI